jgi:hypothetical protein
VALRDLLTRVPDEFPEYHAATRVDSDAPVYQLIVHEIPDAVAGLIGDRRPYKVQGSTGAGNVTPAPWIAVFDRAVTESAQSGYYFVYLFSLDLQRVYACLALGVTEFEQTYGKNRKMLEHLDRFALHLASKHSMPSRFPAGNIDLGAERPTQLHGLYEHSSIAAVEYDTRALPSDEVLRSDLLSLLSLYDRLRRDDGPDVDEEASVAGVEVEQGGMMEEVPFEPAKKGAKGSKARSGRRRSRASKKIGDAGEKRVVEHEVERLTLAGRSDLAARVRWVADQGETPGYDVFSFNEDGSERWIEVKTSKGDKVTTVDLTESERLKAESAPPDRYWLYIVTRVFRGARVTPIQDPVRSLTWRDGNPKPTSWSLRLE